MRHGSLFSGIGGFDLAAEWMGWNNIFHCEWNEFGQKILKYYWPKAISYDDITKTDFTIHRGQIDILTGGFPCQPYSQAGKRLGKEDDRHLWPEMLRAVREIQPRWIVGENVYGLVNWSGGLVFEEVQADLEAEGYEVQAFILPACAKNAPHRRDRIWFVAKSCNKRCNHRGDNRQERQIPHDKNRNIPESKSERNGRERRIGEIGDFWNVTDTGSKRLEGRKGFNKREKYERKRGGLWNKITTGCGSWSDFPTVSPVCDGNDGLSSRLVSITFPKWRSESIKAGGNAIVPQVVHEIFKAIEQYEHS